MFAEEWLVVGVVGRRAVVDSQGPIVYGGGGSGGRKGLLWMEGLVPGGWTSCEGVIVWGWRWLV